MASVNFKLKVSTWGWVGGGKVLIDGCINALGVIENSLQNVELSVHAKAT
jgi:hypothetical protein